MRVGAVATIAMTLCAVLCACGSDPLSPAPVAAASSASLDRASLLSIGCSCCSFLVSSTVCLCAEWAAVEGREVALCFARGLHDATLTTAAMRIKRRRRLRACAHNNTHSTQQQPPLSPKNRVQARAAERQGTVVHASLEATLCSQSAERHSGDRILCVRR